MVNNMAIIDADTARHKIVSNYPGPKEYYRQQLHERINSLVEEYNTVHAIMKLDVLHYGDFKNEYHEAVSDVILDLKFAGYVDVELVGSEIRFRCVPRDHKW